MSHEVSWPTSHRGDSGPRPLYHSSLSVNVPGKSQTVVMATWRDEGNFNAKYRRDSWEGMERSCERGGHSVGRAEGEGAQPRGHG